MGKKEQTIDVVVKYPDQSVTFTVPSTITSKEMLIKACSHCNLYEFWWFNIIGTDMNNNNITSQHLYESSKYVYPLKFQVRFYPIDIKSETIQTATWKFMYRELRTQIMTEKLYCDPTTIVKLAALHFHYKEGDLYRGDGAKVAIKETLDTLVPKGVKKRHSIDDNEWVTIIYEMWLSNKNLAKPEALTEALNLIQNLDQYGVCYFEIKNKKGTDLWLGVDCDGLQIYKSNNKLVPEVGLGWAEIKSVQYVDSRFIIKPLDRNAPTFQMISVNVEHNQYMMATIIANHKMYIQRRSRTEPDEIVEYKSKATEAQLVEKKKMAEEIADKKRAIEMEAKLNAIEEQVIAEKAENVDENKLMNQYTYEQELDAMNKKMLQLQMDAKNEREKNNLTEEELEKLRQAQLATEQRLAKEQQEKIELEMKENQALALAAEKAAEAERAKAELEAMKLKYEQDQKALREIAAKKAAGEEIKKKEKENTNAKIAEQNTEKFLQDKNKARNECDLRYENIKKTGRTKHQTLKLIRTGNTGNRIDKFEAL